MSRLYQRAIIPLLLAGFIVFGYLVSYNSRKDIIHETSNLIFDSFTHSSQKPNPPGSIDSGAEQKINKPQTSNEEESKEPELDPCTAINPLSHAFIDLSALSSAGNDGKALPWISKGYDSGHNYTIGICSNPFKKNHDESNEIANNLNASKVGGYYIDSETNQYVSIGEFSTDPKFVGKKLTLVYENGSYCNVQNTKTGQRLRKSTTLKFTCDREMPAKAAITYLGSFEDCSYFFEVRSHYACPTAAKSNDFALGWIFLLIILAALFVYFSGGLLYSEMKKRHQPKELGTA